MKKRELFIDYAKAISILLVVCTHAGIGWINNIGYIPMTLFFFASGYTSHYDKRSASDSIKKLFKKVMIPFWIAMLFYGIFEIFRAQYLQYGTAEIFLPAMIGLVYGSSHKVPVLPGMVEKIQEIMSYKPIDMNSKFCDVILPTNCHLWYLPAFFTGTVLFILYLNFLGKKRKTIIVGVTILVLLGLASLESFSDFAQLPYGLGRGFYCCACTIVGKWCNVHSTFTHFMSNKRKAFTLMALLLVISVATYYTGAGKSALVRSEYGPLGVLSVVIVFIGGISATILVLMILKLIGDMREFHAIAFVGQHTMTIYLWHMVWVNVISFLILYITGIGIARDEWYMAIIPETHIFLILFTAFLSVGCCLGIELLKNRIINDKKAALHL